MKRMGPLFDSARLRRSRHLDFGYVSRPNLQSSDASCAAYDLHGPLNSVRVELKLDYSIAATPGSKVANLLCFHSH
jgi:hypothetical protein